MLPADLLDAALADVDDGWTDAIDQASIEDDPDDPWRDDQPGEESQTDEVLAQIDSGDSGIGSQNGGQLGLDDLEQMDW